MTLEIGLQTAALVVAIGGLAGLRWIPSDRRVIALAFVVSTVVILGGIGLYLGVAHYQRVQATQSKVLVALGKKIRSYDDLYRALNYPDDLILAESLDSLAERNLIGEQLVELKVQSGQAVMVRAYYAR
jgi:hypothetical protein